MAYKLTDLLRWWQAEGRDERPVFKSDSEAYDFCREAYARTGGVSPDLRLTYEFYVKNFDDARSDGDRPFQRKPQYISTSPRRIHWPEPSRPVRS